MFTRDYSLRDAVIGGDGRTVVLACVPFDQEAMVDDGDGLYREVFRRGAFTHLTGAARHTELKYTHDPGMPYGFGIDLVEDPHYLLGSFRVAPSLQGDQLLALVRDDQLQGVSIGYIAGAHPGDNRETLDDRGRLVERVRVKRLPHVALTPAPAYVGAQVLAVREQSDELARLELQRRRARAAWDIYKVTHLR